MFYHLSKLELWEEDEVDDEKSKVCNKVGPLTIKV